MKTYKRLLTIAIVISMMCGLIACGSKDTVESSDSTTKDNKISTEENGVTKEDKEETIIEAEVGTILDAPEKLFEADKFYVLLSYPDEENESGISTMEIVLDDTVTPGVVYLTSGLLKTDELIYELNEDGTITKYYKDVFMEDYVLIDDATQEELQEEKQSAMEIMSQVGWCADIIYEGVQYKKCENEWNAFFGDVFVYEMLYEGENFGKISVDMETGLWVKEEYDGEEIMSVTMYRETDLGIPEYK